jgi:hypothetical protein
VRVTLRVCTRATAYRLPGERQAMGGEPVAGPRWRRQLLEPPREPVIVWAHGHEGLGHRAEEARLLGVKRQERPPALGSRRQVVAP